MEEQNQQNQFNKPKRKFWDRTTIILMVILGILLIGVGVMGYLYYEKYQEEQQVRAEKNALIEDFQELSNEYEEVQTQNDTLQLKLTQKQLRIQKLINEINTIKRTNAQIIRKYKNELGTLREIMRSYIVQIDSLNRSNEMLRAENREIRQKYQQTAEELEEEKEIKEKLSQQVEKAAILDATDIVAVGVNDRGNEKDKINRVEKIRVCFILRENAVAESGPRDIYLRITRPDSVVLANSQQSTISVRGEELIYSARREVNYENQNLDVCIYYDPDQEQLVEGDYRVSLYSKGAQIGESSFALKEGLSLFF